MQASSGAKTSESLSLSVRSLCQVREDAPYEGPVGMKTKGTGSVFSAEVIAWLELSLEVTNGSKLANRGWRRIVRRVAHVKEWRWKTKRSGRETGYETLEQKFHRGLCFQVIRLCSHAQRKVRRTGLHFRMITLSAFSNQSVEEPLTERPRKTLKLFHICLLREEWFVGLVYLIILLLLLGG